jgi:3-oxoadipate enol-lactonase
MAALVQDTIQVNLFQNDKPIDIEIIYCKGQQVKYKTEGSGRPAVILLPFWGGTARTYRTLQNQIAQDNPEITTIAISYPGTGNSSRDIIDPTIDPFTKGVLHDLASVVELLVPQLATKGPCIDFKKGVVLVGHSMGAKVATKVLVSDAEQKLRIKGVLLLGPAPPGPLVLSPAERKFRAKTFDTYQSAKFALTEILGLVTASDQIVSDCIQDALGMDDIAKRGWIESGIDEDLSPDLIMASPEVKKTRIRILAGREDRAEPPDQVQLLVLNAFKNFGEFVDVSMETLQLCGHMMVIENAAEVGEAVRKMVEHGNLKDFDSD